MRLLKNTVSILAAAAFFLWLSGCNPPAAGEPPATPSPTASLLEATDIVSPLAARDYLTFDDSSWKREFLPEFVVVHFTSAVVLNKQTPCDIQSIRPIFETSEIGINYVVDRSGAAVCWLPEERAAWHAGSGTWNNDPKYTNTLNKYSIGIELFAIGSQNDMAQYLHPWEYEALDSALIGYTEEQYATLSALIADICSRWHIPCDRRHILGHEEYSPGKTDPGELFDWDKLMSLTKQKLENPT